MLSSVGLSACYCLSVVVPLPAMQEGNLNTMVFTAGLGGKRYSDLKATRLLLQVRTGPAGGYCLLHLQVRTGPARGYCLLLLQVRTGPARGYCLLLLQVRTGPAGGYCLLLLQVRTGPARGYCLLLPATLTGAPGSGCRGPPRGGGGFCPPNDVQVWRAHSRGLGVCRMLGAIRLGFSYAGCWGL